MPSCASAQPTKGDDITQRDMLPTGLNLDECPRSPAKPEEDEDEDEDVDFNPFLKGTPSPDASSSLSSEVEGIDGVAFENRVQSYNGVEIPASEMTDEVQSFGVDDSERCDEENLVQTVPFPEVAYEEELPKLVPRTLANKDIGTSGQDNDGCCLEKDDDASSRPDLNGVMVKEAANNGKTVMNFDDEDAICKRTRARYSLASFTLDELESFLQETDDDGDLQLVDEEEEYRKFLAGVLLGGDGDGHSTQENGTVDEDEDNDADFEIELEEALESDPDERSNDKSAKGNFEPPRRRPETRQNRRQNASAEFKRKLLEQGKRPLRPLLPLMPIGHNLHSPTSMAKHTIADATPDYASLTANSGFINGFTLSQIGQLYCLVHEHVQLLIQIYSLCILDPSRQHIASQVEELILEMLHKRDQVVAWRSVPYPAICFSPSYICSLVSDGPHRSCLAQHTYLSASAFSAQRFSSTTNSQMPAILSGSQCEGQGDNACSWPVSSKAMDRPIWLPYINGPVISVLDVAPLNLAKSYIHDLHIAVEDLRRRHVESSCDIRSEREPLFPLGSSLSAAENDGRDFGGATSVNSQSGSPSSSQQPLKRSLAAAIVESTKKQSVALVPKEVAKLAQRFLPLFDQAMFPHKPPSMAVVNRVLFTDAEDELLALGIMEYNTDWKAIQQRFLPCKSKHQIFVRQKNRCSSKAPENPIKAVRRMKTSPLTAEEIQHIQEGLKIYKLDWMSICKFIVPHRDPSLLPRQWRVALGTQKSYKQDEAKKEKRRMYEKRRKMRRGADLPSSQQGSEEDYQVENAGGENSSGDDCIDDPEEAFVHEGFLADWRPGTSGLISLEQPCSFVGGHSLPGTMEQSNNHKFGKASCHPGNMHQVAFASNFQNPYRGQWTQTLTNPVSDKSWKMSSNQLYSFSYWGQQTQTPQLVKLAPNLPPVNLPQNVRVISQPAYKNHDGALAIVSTSGASNAVLADADQVIYRTKKVGEILPPKANLNKVSSLDGSDARQEESRVIKEKCNNDEISIGSDSEMHPLLFQASGDDRLRYYPSNTNTTTCSSFSFFSGSQPQLNLTLFHNPHPPSLVADRHNKSLRPRGASNPCATDFHPLLKEAEVASSCVSLDTGTNISCSVDRTSELDLEMHLSSTSTMVEAVERNDVMGSKLMMPAPHAENSGSSLNSRQISSPVCQQSKNLSLEGSKLVSGSQALVGLNDGIDRCNLEMVTDQSHPGIVMEQEELSDSDENLEENVEFECEEMADSEGEEDSGTELVGDTRMKEVQNLVTEKVMKTRQDQLDEPTNSHFLGSDISAPVNGSLPFLNLGLKSKGKDKVSKSWLSLDSQVQVCSSSATGECHARQKRSYTAKACPRKRMVQMQNQTIETAEQLDLANSTVTSRRPRKRTCRSNASLDAVAV